MKKRIVVILGLFIFICGLTAVFFYKGKTSEGNSAQQSESTLVERTEQTKKTVATEQTTMQLSSAETTAETVAAFSCADNDSVSYAANTKVNNTQSGSKNKKSANGSKNSSGKSGGKGGNGSEQPKSGGKQQEKNNHSEFMPLKASNLVDSKELSDVKNLLKEHKLGNIDVVTSLMKDFNKAPHKGTGMVDKWSDVKKIKYDDFALANRWQNNYTRMDSNCRITAFLLLMDRVSVKKTISDSGSYLMFDLDVIENATEYKAVKSNQKKFITLFNEIDVSGKTKQEIAKAYGEKWKQYGISIKGDNVSLISVVIHDNYDNVVFVGHTGVLIDLGNKLVFIEKIAFEQPYQVSVFNNREELRDMFSGRPTYFGDGTEEGPFIYENDKLIFTYNKK